jgi:hypothetical protein
MSTHDSAPPRKRSRTRWTIPLTALAIGLAYLVAGLVGDDTFFGVFGLLIMVTAGAAFLVLSHFSETVAGLMDRRDERINALDRDATLIAGSTVLAAVLVGLVVEIARGHDGMPYAALGAIGGVSYLLALIVLRLRR